MHLTLSRNTHPIKFLPNDNAQPMQLFCKIPCSTLAVCVDALYKRLFLMDMQPAYSRRTQEVAGYELDDLVVQSIPLFDPEIDSASCMCGGLACDETGHTIFALMLDKPRAYIRLYRHLNRELSHLGVTYEIPWDDGVTEYLKPSYTKQKGVMLYPVLKEVETNDYEQVYEPTTVNVEKPWTNTVTIPGWQEKVYVTNLVASDHINKDGGYCLSCGQPAGKDTFGTYFPDQCRSWVLKGDGVPEYLAYFPVAPLSLGQAGAWNYVTLNPHKLHWVAYAGETVKLEDGSEIIMPDISDIFTDAYVSTGGKNQGVPANIPLTGSNRVELVINHPPEEITTSGTDIVDIPATVPALVTVKKKRTEIVLEGTEYLCVDVCPPRLDNCFAAPAREYESPPPPGGQLNYPPYPEPDDPNTPRLSFNLANTPVLSAAQGKELTSYMAKMIVAEEEAGPLYQAWKDAYAAWYKEYLKELQKVFGTLKGTVIGEPVRVPYDNFSKYFYDYDKFLASLKERWDTYQASIGPIMANEITQPPLTVCSRECSGYCKVGQVDTLSETTAGSGLAYKNNRLYAMTYRKMKAVQYYDYASDILFNSKDVFYPPTGYTEYESSFISRAQNRGHAYYPIKQTWKTVTPQVLGPWDIREWDFLHPYIEINPGNSPFVLLRSQGGECPSKLTVKVGHGEMDFSLPADALKDDMVINLSPPGSSAADSYTPITYPNYMFNGPANTLNWGNWTWAAWDRRVVGHVRYSEMRSEDYWITVLHTIDALDGRVKAVNALSEPTQDHDAVFNGLAVYDDKLLIGKRYDSQPLPCDIMQWHAEKMTAHLPWNLKEFEKYQPLAELYWGAAAAEDKQPPPSMLRGSLTYGEPDFEADMDWSGTARHYMDIIKPTTYPIHHLRRKLTEIQDLYDSYPVRKMYPTPRGGTRGPSEIAVLPVPEDSVNTTMLVTQPKYAYMPFDIMLPSALSADDSERKVFAVVGAEVWTFNALDCTIMVDYPDGLAEGDIIDFGDILDAEPKEIPCYLRNDSSVLMENVKLTIHLEDDDPRRDDLFLKTPDSQEGFKSITLGDILPGGSAEFSVRAYALQVQHFETQLTYRVPLHVEWNRRTYSQKE